MDWVDLSGFFNRTPNTRITLENREDHTFGLWAENCIIDPDSPDLCNGIVSTKKGSRITMEYLTDGSFKIIQREGYWEFLT